jgi:hypothetical protein
MRHRYWFQFTQTTVPSILNLGCGITAFDRNDAERIFHDDVTPLYGRREIIAIVEDIDVSVLDNAHVRPNMGDPSARGVWFPMT